MPATEPPNPAPDQRDLSWRAAQDRYDAMSYRRCGTSGLKLPAISLGLWQNFGGDRPLDNARAILRRAFDLGVTHIDLANNYGPPYGAAESTFGQVLASDLGRHRDELIVSTKAGYDMWPGPYGDGGSRKYLLASLDQSLTRMGLNYVDIFYSHRYDPDTPLEETLGALDTAVRSGKALYAGVSNYPAEVLDRAAGILADLGTPLLIDQPVHSLFDRHIEPDIIETAARRGVGLIVFSPLAQGRLTDRYLDGVPAGSRATHSRFLSADQATADDVLRRSRALNEVARAGDRTLAQLALAWVLRRPEITSALIGASSVAQLEANVAALRQPPLSQAELDAVDEFAAPAGQRL
ncbi:aldo/keto reductase [Jatrophihabitans telluris]|uniref:Aldo/keto reductase n=1 Tax=Jatrophihabitans telluris TaxID=2038343 RepID=A0ABY4R1F9_9ACTN|nr:aldo/keto reductase [Jatrophihabitans telluris]UQX89763.1 aldo/keto reductase [Jatrophihabitans telluris]